MKKMKKLVAGVTLGAMMVLAGCGGGGSANSDGSAAAEADKDAK